GAGAYQFTAYTIYDPLVAWEMDVADRPGKLVSGLATEWKVDDNDKTKWRFTLRKGVKFHDGSDFNADAVIWNLDKVLNDKAPQFDKRQSAQVKTRLPSVASYAKVDDFTIEITTKTVDSFFPYQMLWFLVSSPAQYEKLGKDWDKFASQPSGTGPFKLTKLVPRELAELTKNPDYWDKKRLAKVDKMILIPMPEANARTAALLSGQVNWIEAPAPDALPEIKQRGFNLYSNEEPHVWPWQFSRVEGSPWNDIRVRKAANLCIDREGLRDGLLAGLMVPATGTFEPGHPWRGNPTFQIKYDKPAAQKLMQEAGFGPNKKLTVKIQTSASGSGQMLPLPMNEYLQQALAECYFDVQLDVIEWNTLFTNWRRGTKDPTANGSNAINVTYAAMDPFFALVRFLQSGMAPPVSNNWGFNNNPKFDELVKKARQTFEPAARDAALAELHAASVDDAAFLYVAHDVAPRAMSPKIKGFVQPKSWFVDFSPVTVAP
ncbi:ABC transporter substrate-binding protein, partial [Bradyrhizobium brasilense]|uniref:ABC transporter substrate-binding protein n=1 Tax=Bradyrhizobium brasilense TaxID=1419277 RepID=UPI00145788FB